MSRRLQPVLFALFFITGLTGLVYELLWVRLLTLVFGATVLAVSTVLATFFAGMALGGAVFGRLVDRLGKPLLLYGLLEVGVGLYASMVPFLLDAVRGAYPEMARSLAHSFPLLSLVRFSVCALLILVPTALMGGALPVLSRLMAGRRERIGLDVGLLYAVNAAGAAVGCLATGFLLLELLGVSRSHALAVGLNLGVGIVALCLHRFAKRVERRLRSEQKAFAWRRSGRVQRLPAHSKRVARCVLAAFAASGATALGYEVIWTRSLGVTLHATAYSFALILTAFLAGLGLGSYLYGRAAAAEPKRPVFWFGAIQVALGLCALGSIHFVQALPDLAARFVQPMEGQWAGLIALQFLLCLALLLVPASLFGAAFPLVVRICVTRAQGLGWTVGSVSAVNSLGAIAGSFLAGFVLIPAIGVKHGTMVLAAVNLVIGLAALGRAPHTGARSRRGAVTTAAAVAAVAFAAAAATDLHVGIGGSAGQRRILFYRDGLVANVRVEQTADDVVLLINGKVQAGRRGARASQGLGHISMLLHPAPRRVLAIGLGTGMTAGAIGRHPVESLEIVDLVDDLVATASYFTNENHAVLSDPRTTFTVADGRNYLLTADGDYDVVVSDIFFPAGAGTGSLYALEHYQAAQSKLRDGGLMLQWLPLYQLTEEEFRTVAATFSQAFPHVELWLGDPDLRYPVVGLVGRHERRPLDFSQLGERLVARELAGELVYGNDAWSLLCAFLMDGRDLAAYVADAPWNTDDRPRIELSAPRNNYTREHLGWKTVLRLADLKRSVAPLVAWTGLQPEERAAAARRLLDRESARSHYYRGAFALGTGSIEAGLEQFRRARALAPDDHFVDFHTSESAGRLHAELGNRGQAASLLERAASLRPAEANVRLALAAVYAEMERWGMAEAHLSAAVERYPEHAEALVRLGEVYVRQGRREAAESTLQRAVSVLPEPDEDVERMLADVRARLP